MNHTISGRTSTPEQKRAIIERLYASWLDAPTLRLGQLVFIGTGGRDCFYVEDEAFIAELERVIIPSTKEVQS